MTGATAYVRYAGGNAPVALPHRAPTYAPGSSKTASASSAVSSRMHILQLNFHNSDRCMGLLQPGQVTS